ncbi:division/cell wall cluster transcriptional repressor MraZ [Victivallis sp. Marseille-Q1083]|uniref:division/cell wall cluster transcriptional repressor MraZ n=1 Tax=Victivallis sp. Marseille-Q1083 TaxID=2717288 RepID=UPI00158CCF3F|nr:hypothetical protein [Victivallis sp. Marseille-Q1083]
MEELIFFGEKQHALDAQCRLSIPGEWRRREGETRLILIPTPGESLLLFPFESFQDFLVKARSISFSDPAAQKALARLGARSRDCRCDKQGRIKLEREMLNRIGIQTQVCLIGAVTHIRLCAPEIWEKLQYEDEESCFAELQKIGENNPDLARLFQGTIGR